MPANILFTISLILFCLYLFFPSTSLLAAQPQSQQPPASDPETPIEPIPPLKEAKESEITWPKGPAGEAAMAYASGDIAKARNIWEEMAANGDAQAMNNLGVLYDTGKGVEPDIGRALHWFAKSANAGNPSGMNNYGRMLEQGRGMPANAEEAARWFDLAAREGQSEAQYNLGILYEMGRGVPRDETAAAAWYSRAASLRQKDALAKLGHFYRIGKGVEKNPQRGALLLYAAAMEGSDAAIAELEAMAKEQPAKAVAILFGHKLDEVDRAAMQTTLKNSGAKAKREDDSHICDIYEANGIIPGASEMAVCYGPDKKLGFLKIDYIANDKARADAILKMMETRFGPPTAGEGEDARLWNLGKVIVATQYVPTHRLLSLMYMVPAVYHLTREQ